MTPKINPLLAPQPSTAKALTWKLEELHLLLAAESHTLQVVFEGLIGLKPASWTPFSSNIGQWPKPKAFLDWTNHTTQTHRNTSVISHPPIVIVFLLL